VKSNIARWPLIVSQDGEQPQFLGLMPRQSQKDTHHVCQEKSTFCLFAGAHQATAAVIRRYSMTGNLIHLQHPVLEPPTIPPKDK
jgi:hypothetical protein